MRVLGSIQARLGSTRLPGKVLKPILGKPMLLWQVERLKRSRLLDEVVVAATTNPDDDEIARVCSESGVRCFRGSEDDVLGRIAGLIRSSKAEAHAEFFGDSPLTDAHIVDEVIGFFLKHQGEYDLVTNALTTTYPPGQEVNVYRAGALLEADALVPKESPLREHVSIHVTQARGRFRVMNLEAPPHYRQPEIYLEVDTAEDFTVMSAVVEHFAKRGQEHFSLAQILDFLKERGELIEMNSKVPRRWKAFRRAG